MITKLSHVCEFISGHAWPSSKYTDAGIPIIRINNLSANSTDFVYWREEFDPKFLVSKGDILISLSGTIKVFKWNGPESVLNQRIVKVTAKENINNSWIYYQLKHAIEVIANKAKHAVIKNVSINDLKNFEFDLPSIQNQNKVVAVLDKSTELVDKVLKSIELLNGLVKSQFLHLFQEFLINTNTHTKVLADIASINAGITKGRKTKVTEQNEVPYLRVANVQQGYLDFNDIKTIKATERERIQFKIEKGDIFLTEGGDPDTVGRGAIWENEESNYIYQNHLFRVRLKDNANYSPYWLLELINCEFGKGYFLKQAKQTTGIASINSRQVKKFPIPEIPFELQCEFERHLQIVGRHLKKKYQSLNAVEDLFQALLQRAFNGTLNFNIDIELDALLREIDLDRTKNDLTSIVRDEVYIQRLIDKLNNEEFTDKHLYDKAKHGVFQLLRNKEVIVQHYNKKTKEIKLALK